MAAYSFVTNIFPLIQQWRSQHKIFCGPQIWESKMFDFRRAAVFLFETPLLKAQNY